jgi:hypothetical protein
MLFVFDSPFRTVKAMSRQPATDITVFWIMAYGVLQETENVLEKKCLHFAIILKMEAVTYSETLHYCQNLIPYVQDSRGVFAGKKQFVNELSVSIHLTACHSRRQTRKKVKAFFHPMLPDFQNSTPFWKVLRLRPFVRLVRATCRRR